MQGLSIWKNKTFIRLFSSYSISMLGRWFDMVAIMILFSYVWRTDPLIIALIPVAYALPQALFSQFAGILADRFNKVKLMLTADIFTAFLTFALFLTPGPWIALTILLIRATLTVVHFPAEQSLIKHIVHEKLIVKAVTMNGTVDQFTKIVGPFLGGALATAFSPQLCILFNAIAYVISAFILVTLLKKDPTQEQTNEVKKDKKPFWESWREGWSALLSSRILVVSIAFSLIGFTAIQMVDVQFSVLLREIAPDRPELVGWIMGSSGGGALTIMLILNRFEELRGYGWILGSSVLLIGVGFGGAGFLTTGISSIIIIALGFIAGVGVGLFTIGLNVILQRETNIENIGRISGIFSSLTSVMILVAPIIGGALVSIIGVSSVYQFIGVSLTFIGLIGIIFRNRLWREISNQHQPTHFTKTV
ncbi:MFS transporter [Piscibacillus sp. B03]|uniref:MFS transporter n=1 Tax=Piscibacillus sp. B03 TaxID=3457430 RepID=UPI003FCCA7EA